MSLGKVLIVDDEPDLRELLDHNLRRNDFETRQAGDGLSACRLIGEERPDLVLLDLMLPDLDGRDICRMVRSHQDPRIAETPILMLTALSLAADRVSGLHVGADDYLAKPFSVDEVALRSKRLVSARKRHVALCEELEKAHRRQENMAELQDMLFHDLKNQLLVVKGFSKRISEHGDVLPAEKVRSYARAIQRSSSHLGSLAEDLLLLRRIENGEVDVGKQFVAPEALVEEVLDLFRGLAEERGISLDAAVPRDLPPLSVNHAAIRIVLSSLVENAVKYGRTGGSVQVHCSVGRDGACLAVEDDGMGVPEGEIDRIFEKFFRGSRAANVSAGTGLGLYFARKLTAAQGGRIRCESEVGRGSRFIVELPA